MVLENALVRAAVVTDLTCLTQDLTLHARCHTSTTYPVDLFSVHARSQLRAWLQALAWSVGSRRSTASRVPRILKYPTKRSPAFSIAFPVAVPFAAAM